MMWETYLERQMWKEANNITRAFFDELFMHRNQYGRGLSVRILPESWATGLERLCLWWAETLGWELKSYPMPG